MSQARFFGSACAFEPRVLVSTAVMRFRPSLQETGHLQGEAAGIVSDT
jgi:hypothetical protein